MYDVEPAPAPDAVPGSAERVEAVLAAPTDEFVFALPAEEAVAAAPTAE